MRRSEGATPPLWTFAVASHEELAKVAAPLGLIYGPGKNEIIHNLCTAVIGPDGKLARLEVGTKSNKWTTADLLKTIYFTAPPVRSDRDACTASIGPVRRTVSNTFTRQALVDAPATRPPGGPRWIRSPRANKLTNLSH